MKRKVIETVAVKDKTKYRRFPARYKAYTIPYFHQGKKTWHCESCNTELCKAEIVKSKCILCRTLLLGNADFNIEKSKLENET